MSERLTRTRVWREALSIAVPLMLAESVGSVFWIIDAYFVSRLGDKALAAVALGSYVSWIVTTPASMFYIGALVLVSQAVGARRRGEAARIAGEALTANIALSLPLTVATYTAAPWIVDALAGPKATGEVKALAVDYLRARLVGLPLVYADMVLGAVYRGFGATRPVFASTAVYAVANTVLDPILIFGLSGAPALGVAGAGYASVLASAASTGFLLAAAPRSLGTAVPVAAPGAWAVRGARLGVFPLIERSSIAAAHLIYLGVVARCGDVALAAHSIGVRIESLAFMPLYAIGEASAVVVGQRVGAGGSGEGERAGWLMAQLSMTIGVAVALALVAASRFAPGYFTSDPNVAALAGLYLILAAVTEPMYALSESLFMSIRGAGNTVVPTVANIASLYGLRVTTALVMPRIFGPGDCVLGAWLGMVADMSGRMIASTAIYRRLFRRLARRLV